MIFLDGQAKEQTEDYVKMLKAVGSLSRLFTDSDVPFLYYRAAENIFCKAFEADNKSRSDVSVDAVKGDRGIGLKTYRYKNSQLEKVAEFNKNNSLYSSLSAKDLVHYVAESRNERIETTSQLYELGSSLYHCVARKKDTFILYETNMDLVDINSIRDISTSSNGNSISFTDRKNNYTFNRTKSTLFKKFVPPAEVFQFNVDIMEDPYSAIVNLMDKYDVTFEKVVTGSAEQDQQTNCVILPLYSLNPRSGEDRVAKRSGLNQWNAEGRPRNPNEVYIQIPAWIHHSFPEFFPERDIVFNLRLPDNHYISAKVCQDGRKALMSNPNSDLGEWLLRKILQLREGELLTYELLEKIGIDSVAIYKEGTDNFSIEFKKLGSYEDFIEKVAAN